jgi:hypothetical protein
VFMVSLPRRHLSSKTDDQDSNSLPIPTTETKDISPGYLMERGAGT